MCETCGMSPEEATAYIRRVKAKMQSAVGLYQSSSSGSATYQTSI